MNKAFLRAGKFQQSPDLFGVFQVSVAGPAKPGGRLFLLIDGRQESAGVRLLRTKPTGVKAAGALSNLIRKHVASAVIGRILQHKNGDLQILLSKGRDHIWSLWLRRGRPPCIELVSPDGVSLLRYGHKGTFTKRQSVPAEPEDGEKTDILPAMLAELSRTSLVSRQISSAVIVDSTLA